MAEPHDLPTSPEGWAAVIAGLLTIAKGAQIVLRKVGLGPDYEKMAEAFFAKKASEDAKHRDVLAAAISDMTRAQRETTAAIQALATRLEAIHHETTDHVTEAFRVVGDRYAEIDKALAVMAVRGQR